MNFVGEMEKNKKIDFQKFKMPENLKKNPSKFSEFVSDFLTIFLILFATALLLLLCGSFVQKTGIFGEISFESFHEHNAFCPVKEAGLLIKQSEKYNWSENYGIYYRISPLNLDKDGMKLIQPTTEITVACDTANCTTPDWANSYAQIIFQQIPLKFLELDLQSNQAGHQAFGSFHLLKEDGVPKAILQYVFTTALTEVNKDRFGVQMRFASVSRKGQEVGGPDVKTELDAARQGKRRFAWNPFFIPPEMVWTHEESKERARFVGFVSLMSSLGIEEVAEKKNYDSHFDYHGLHQDVESLLFFSNENGGFQMFQKNVADYVRNWNELCSCLEQSAPSSTAYCWESWKFGQKRNLQFSEYCEYLKNLQMESKHLYEQNL